MSEALGAAFFLLWLLALLNCLSRDRRSFPLELEKALTAVLDAGYDVCRGGGPDKDGYRLYGRNAGKDAVRYVLLKFDPKSDVIGEDTFGEVGEAIHALVSRTS